MFLSTRSKRKFRRRHSCISQTDATLRFTNSAPFVDRVYALHRQCREAPVTEDEVLALLIPNDCSVAKQFIAIGLIQLLADKGRRDQLWMGIITSHEFTLPVKKAAARMLARFTDSPEVLFKLLISCYKVFGVAGAAPRVAFIAKYLWKNGKTEVVNKFVKSLSWAACLSLKELLTLLPYCSNSSLVWSLMMDILPLVWDDVRFWSKMIKYHSETGSERIFSYLLHDGLSRREYFFDELLGCCCRHSPSFCIDLLCRLWKMDSRVKLPAGVAKRAPRVLARGLMQCPGRMLEPEVKLSVSRVGEQLAPLLMDRIELTQSLLLEGALRAMKFACWRKWWAINEGVVGFRRTPGKYVNVFEGKAPPDIREKEARRILSFAGCDREASLMFKAIAALPHEESMALFAAQAHNCDASFRTEWHKGLALHFKWQSERKDCCDDLVFDEYLKLLQESGNEQCPVRIVMWEGLNLQREALLVCSEERMAVVYSLFRQALKAVDHNWDLSQQMQDIAMKMYHLTEDLRACQMIKSSLYGDKYRVFHGNPYLRRLTRDAVKLRQIIKMGHILTGDIYYALPQDPSELEVVLPVIEEILSGSPQQYPELDRIGLIKFLGQKLPEKAERYWTAEMVRSNITVWYHEEIVRYFARKLPHLLEIYLYELKGDLLSQNKVYLLPLKGRDFSHFLPQHLIAYGRLVAGEIRPEVVRGIDALIDFRKWRLGIQLPHAEPYKERDLTISTTLRLQTKCLLEIMHYVGLPIYNEFVTIAEDPVCRRANEVRSYFLAIVARGGDINRFNEILKMIHSEQAQVGLDRDYFKRQSSPVPLIRALYTFLPRFIRLEEFTVACQHLIEKYLLQVLPLLTKDQEPPQNAHTNTSGQPPACGQLPTSGQLPASGQLPSGELEGSEREGSEREGSEREGGEREGRKKDLKEGRSARGQEEEEKTLAEKAIEEQKWAMFRLNLYRAMAVLSLSDRLEATKSDVFLKLMEAYERKDFASRVSGAIMKRTLTFRYNTPQTLGTIKLFLKREDYYLCRKCVRALPRYCFKEADLVDMVTIAFGRDAEFRKDNERYGDINDDERLSYIFIRRIVESSRDFRLNEGVLGTGLYRILQHFTDPIKCLEGHIARRFGEGDELYSLLLSLATDQPYYTKFRAAVTRLHDSATEKMLLVGPVGLKLYDTLKTVQESLILRIYVVLLLTPFGPERSRRVNELIKEEELAVFFLHKAAVEQHRQQNFDDIIDDFLLSHSQSEPHLYLALALLAAPIEINWNPANLQRLSKLRTNPISPLVRSMAQSLGPEVPEDQVRAWRLACGLP